jgi:hypothetical protein
MPHRLISNLLGLVGALIGSVVGFYTFRWLYGQGFYGLMIPGAFVGLGCGLLAQHHSIVRGVLCGVAAVMLAVFTEWRFRPFDADNSLTYFIQHMSDLAPVTLLMMGLGALIAFWVAKDAGIRRGPEGRPPAPPGPRPGPAKKD